MKHDGKIKSSLCPYGILRNDKSCHLKQIKNDSWETTFKNKANHNSYQIPRLTPTLKDEILVFKASSFFFLSESGKRTEHSKGGQQNIGFNSFEFV